MKTKITLVLAILFSVHSFGQSFTFNGINYLILSPTSVRVDSNRQFTGIANIPSIVTYGGFNYTVDEIFQLAFAGSGLTSITIPNTVKSIAKESFYGCLSLTSVTIPNSITSIGIGAFGNCSSLVSIAIPNSVTSIGGGAFGQCTSLTSFIIPNAVKSIENGTFQACTSLTSFSIPNSVTNIEDNAFNKCTGLSSVAIPNSVTNIGYNAFSECSSLTSISIPNSVTTIGQLAFSSCSSLSSVSIPNSVTSLGIAAFSNCTSLASVSIGNSITTINPSTFSNCTKLNSIFIPNSVTTIGVNAFVNCSSLNSVTIPNTVTSIDSQAFSNCINLNLVTVNWSTPLPITYSVFLGSDLSKTTLNVPYGSETAYKAANYWKEFGTISAVAAPVVLGQKFAVAGISYQVTKATLPYEVAIGANGGNSNGRSGRTTSSLKTGVSGALIIPDTVTNGGNSFSVTSILAYAFQNSTGLTTVTIPSSITNIGDFAFSNCSGLTAVTVNATTPLVINSNVFQNIILANVTLNTPVGSETAYKEANVWKDFKIATTLGSNNFSLKNNLKFYPNPTQSLITFPQEINNLEVFDVTGKKVKSFKNPSASYDFSILGKGIYLLKGITTDGISINEKMIKN